MANPGDVQFARVILKRGWLGKEDLEAALAEVEHLKARDPELSLKQYLGLKELVSWEQLDWVSAHLAAAAPPPAASSPAAPKPAAGASAPRARPAAAPRAHAAPARRTGGRTHRQSDTRTGQETGGRHHPDAHHHAQATFVKKRKDRTTVMAVALGAAVVVLIGVVICVVTGRNGEEPQAHRGAQPPVPAPAKTETAETSRPAEVSAEEQMAFSAIAAGRDPQDMIQRAKGFLARYPHSARAAEARQLADRARHAFESDARQVWGRIRSDFDGYMLDHRFADLMARCRDIARTYPGTETAAEADNAANEVKTRWAAAVAQKLHTIEGLVAAEDFATAEREAEQLLMWCGAETRSRVNETLAAIRKKKSVVDLARATPLEATPVEEVRPEESAPPEETTDPFEPVGSGSGADGSELVIDPGGEEREDTEESAPMPAPGKNDLVAAPPARKGTGDDLFKRDPAAAGVEDHPIVKAIEAHGVEHVARRLRSVIRCSHLEVEASGLVKIGYAFCDRDDHLAADWTPVVGENPRIRWSVRGEGDLTTIWYGVRISDQHVFTNRVGFTKELSMEMCFLNAMRLTARSHLMPIMIDLKSRTCYGANFGSQAVRTDMTGRIQYANPRVRGEAPQAMEVRWFRYHYKGGVVTAYHAYGEEGRGAWLRMPPAWEDSPNFRESGTVKVTREPATVYPAIRFYPDICGTVGFVRLSGYLSEEWLAKNKVTF